MEQNQLQVCLTAVFGDGHFALGKGHNNMRVVFSSIHGDYLEYKKLLLGDLCTASVNRYEKNQGTFVGSNCKPIHKLESRSSLEITQLHANSVDTNLYLLDETGIALWFFDDGSFHKKKHFYNLNTHHFDKETQYDLFIPFFASIGIEARLRPDRKKDGREYWYLYIPPSSGKIVSSWMEKHVVEGLRYKVWSSETIPEGSRDQVEPKSVTIPTAG